jgi:hypothetical protein
MVCKMVQKAFWRQLTITVANITSATTELKLKHKTNN